jgi:hypothetical protein
MDLIGLVLADAASVVVTSAADEMQHRLLLIAAYVLPFGALLLATIVGWHFVVRTMKTSISSGGERPWRGEYDHAMYLADREQTFRDEELDNTW